MFERRHHPLLPIRSFIQRLFYHLLIGLAIIAVSLGIGMAGYRHFEHMSWPDAYENATMILSGMGPVDPIYTTHGKIFAGTYALFSGIIFLVVIAIILIPLFHRFLHRFLVKDKND